MLEDYLDRKQFTKDLLCNIVFDLKQCDIKLSVYFNDTNAVVVEYNNELIKFISFRECYEWFVPLISKCIECFNKEEHKVRIMRDLIVGACEKIESKYKNTKFCVNFLDTEEEEKKK